jgi:hypothetical protein
MLSGTLSREISLFSPSAVGSEVHGRSNSSSFMKSLLELRIGREWDVDALCQQVDPDIFFPSKGVQPKSATGTCGLCDVRGKCLEYALKFDPQDDQGVWGGTTERERKVIRNALKRGIEVDYENVDLESLSNLVAEYDNQKS